MDAQIFRDDYVSTEKERHALLAQIRHLVPESVFDALESGSPSPAAPTPMMTTSFRPTSFELAPAEASASSLGESDGAEEHGDSAGYVDEDEDDVDHDDNGDSRGWLAHLIGATTPAAAPSAAAAVTPASSTRAVSTSSFSTLSTLSTRSVEVIASQSSFEPLTFAPIVENTEVETFNLPPPQADTASSYTPSLPFALMLDPVREDEEEEEEQESFYGSAAAASASFIGHRGPGGAALELAHPNEVLPGRHHVSDELAAALGADGARGEIGALDVTAVRTERLTSAVLRASECTVEEMGPRTLHLVGTAAAILKLRHALKDTDWSRVEAAVEALSALTLGVAAEARGEFALLAAECEDRTIDATLSASLRKGGINGEVGKLNAGAVRCDALAADISAVSPLTCHTERSYRTMRSAEIVLELRRLFVAGDFDSLCEATERLPSTILDDITDAARNELRVVLREVNDLRLQSVLMRAVRTHGATGSVGAVDSSRCEVGAQHLLEALHYINDQINPSDAPPTAVSETTTRLLATAKVLGRLREGAGQDNWRDVAAVPPAEDDDIALEAQDEVKLLQREGAHWKVCCELERCLTAEKRSFAKFGIQSISQCDATALLIAVSAAERLGVLGTAKGQAALRTARGFLALRSALLAENSELTLVAVHNAEAVAASGVHPEFAARTCVWSLEMALVHDAASGNVGALDLSHCATEALERAMSNAQQWNCESDVDVARLLRSAHLVRELRRSVLPGEYSGRVALADLQRAAEDARETGVIQTAVREVALLMGESEYRAAAERLRSALMLVPSTFGAIAKDDAEEKSDELREALRAVERLAASGHSSDALRLLAAARYMVDLRTAMGTGDVDATTFAILKLRELAEPAELDPLPTSARAKVQAIDTDITRAAAVRSLRYAMCHGGAQACEDPETPDCTQLELEKLVAALSDAKACALGSTTSHELTALMQSAHGLLGVRRALHSADASIPYDDGLNPAWRSVGTALIEAQESGIVDRDDLALANAELACVRRAVESRTVVHVLLKLLRRCSADAEVLASAPSYDDFEGDGVPVPHSVPGLVAALKQAREIGSKTVSARASRLVQVAQCVIGAFTAMGKQEYTVANDHLDGIASSCEIPIEAPLRQILDGCIPITELLRAMSGGKAAGTPQKIHVGEMTIVPLGLAIGQHAQKAALGSARAASILRTARLLLALRTFTARLPTFKVSDLDELFRTYNAETSNRFVQPNGSTFPVDLDCLAPEGVEECRLLILFLSERRATTALEMALHHGSMRGNLERPSTECIDFASLTVAVVLGRGGCRSVAAKLLLASAEVVLALRRAMSSGNPDFWRSTAVVLLSIAVPLHSAARSEIIFTRNCLLHAVLSGCLRSVLPDHDNGVKTNGALHEDQRYNELCSAVALADALRAPGGTVEPLPPQIETLLVLSQSALAAPYGGEQQQNSQCDTNSVGARSGNTSRTTKYRQLNSSQVLRFLREIGRDEVIALGTAATLDRLAQVLEVDEARVAQFSPVVSTFIGLEDSYRDHHPAWTTQQTTSF